MNNIKVLISQLKEYTKASLMTPAFMVLEVMMETAVPLMMASIIDDGVEKGDMRHIVLVGVVMLITALIGLYAGILGGKYGAIASAGLAKNLRKSMFEKIQTYSFANIDKFSTGSLITRLTTDVTNVQNAYQMVLRMCIRSIFSVVFAMSMAFVLSAKLASIYLIAVIILGMILACIVRFAMKYFSAMFEKYDELNIRVQENISAIRVVKAFVREEHEKKKFEEAVNLLCVLSKRAENVIAYNAPAMQITVYTCILTISWIGAKMIVGGSLTTGQLMSLLAYCMNILMSLMMMSMVFVMITMSLPGARRIAEVLQEESSIKNPENPNMTVRDGEITFENVTFSYHENSEKPVLDNINLHINSGETIGIIGGTGSSKSSLVNLISRLYDVNEGSVKISGVDVREYDLEVLRSRVAVVLQKNVLFAGTILENLRWGDPEATEKQCRQACIRACADEFISKMPEGYYSKIEQGGANISGGQRQRLCIARALLKKPNILILDDSTSAVDTATDAKIREVFANELPEVTKIIIAQRISSVKDADRIIVMDEGRVDGFGSHEELLATNEIYRDVYESQTGGSGDFDK